MLVCYSVLPDIPREIFVEDTIKLGLDLVTNGRSFQTKMEHLIGWLSFELSNTPNITIG